MKIVGGKGLGKFIEYFLLVLIAVAGVLTLTLYWSIPLFTIYESGQPDGKFIKFFVVLIFSGIMSILILWQARCIMRIINRGNPFVSDLVRRLRLAAMECFVLAVAYLFSIFLVTRFFSVIILVTFSVVGVIILVFAELFRQAIVYKEENDKII